MSPPAEGTGPATGPRSDYCIFVRDGRRFALSTTIAKEVLEARTYTPVPHGPAELLGAFNLRGEVVPLVNLDSFLDATTRPAARVDTLMLLHHGDVVLAAVVDQVVVIRHIPPWEIRRPKLDPSAANPLVRGPFEASPPVRGPFEANPLVRGLFGKDEEHTLVLDGERLVSGIVEKIAAGMRARARVATSVQASPDAPEGSARIDATSGSRGEGMRSGAGAGGAPTGGR